MYFTVWGIQRVPSRTELPSKAGDGRDETPLIQAPAVDDRSSQSEVIAERTGAKLLVGEGRDAVVQDGTGGDGVDADALRRVVEGRTPGEADDSVLGGDVSPEPSPSPDPCRRRSSPVRIGSSRRPYHARPPRLLRMDEWNRVWSHVEPWPRLMP